MACERNRIVELIDYLSSLGVDVNIAKNKARGNKGFFRVKDENFRIDIAKGLSDDAVLSVLIHESAHFIHYQYDKKLKSLGFILDSCGDDVTEELISLTVDSIPKDSIRHLFEAKESLKSQSINPILKKRALNSINSKISRLNRYYNSPTELFARSLETYLTDRNKFSKKAPLLLESYDKALKEDKIPILTKIAKILLYNI